MFCYVLALIGAVGVGMIIAWAESEPGMRCQIRNIPHTDPQKSYRICEWR